MKKLFIIAIMLAGLLVQAGCGSARRGEPITGPLQLSTPDSARGQMVFMRHCHQCHPGGEAGLGPALNNKPLPGFMMILQVRHGLGAMPSFSEQHISDEELDALIAYVKALRHHK
jgi:mono/diheme cytochrome c family protein